GQAAWDAESATHGLMLTAPSSPELKARRAHLCRLTPDRALDSSDEAAAFLADRGLLTLTPDCALPSLFGACHEPGSTAGGRGFAAWPRTRWPWAGMLARRPGVRWLKVH